MRTEYEANRHLATVGHGWNIGRHALAPYTPRATVRKHQNLFARMVRAFFGK